MFSLYMKMEKYIFIFQSWRIDKKVPMLVSCDPKVANDPIIGYIVIEVIKKGRKQLAHKMNKGFCVTVKKHRWQRS